MPEDLREHLKVASRELQDDLGRHLSEEEIVDYVAERLDTAARQRVQSHLARCGACVATHRDVSDFFEPARVGESTAENVEVGREWKRLEKRLNRVAFTVWRFPLAAMLAVALVLTAFYSLRLRSERDELARLAQSHSRAAADLERENRQLRANTDSLGKTITELRAPQLGVPIYDVFSRDSIERSGNADNVNRVTLPTGTHLFCLILSGGGQGAFTVYRVEIADSNGKTVWRGVGYRSDGFGNFVILLDRRFLGPGRYRLRLFGDTRTSSKLHSEYVIELVPR